MSEVLVLSNVQRSYRQGTGELHVLRGVDLTLRAGEVVALMGVSGSGKTTLLQITGLLDSPSAGQVRLAGRDLTRADDAARTAARRESLGFVYQFHHLLPDFSALENIMLPQLISGIPRERAKTRAQELLAIMNLAPRAHHRPAALSGGEQQRVAIARALACGPKLLLADEPTGNLDPHTAEEVFSYLMQTARTLGLAALVATHNPDIASRMDRCVKLEEGRLVRQGAA